MTSIAAAKLMKGQIQWLLGSIAAKQNSFMEQLGTLSVGSRPRRGGGIMRTTGQVSQSSLAAGRAQCMGKGQQ